MRLFKQSLAASMALRDVFAYTTLGLSLLVLFYILHSQRLWLKVFDLMYGSTVVS